MFVFFCGLLCVCGWHWLTIYLAMHLLYSVVLLVACEFYGECFFPPTLDLPDLPIQSKRILAPVAWPYLCFRLHFVFPCFSTITIHLTNLSCSRHSLMIWNRPCFYCMPFGNLIFECTSLGDLLQIVWQNDLFVCFLYVRCTRHCKNHLCVRSRISVTLAARTQTQTLQNVLLSKSTISWVGVFTQEQAHVAVLQK